MVVIWWTYALLLLSVLCCCVFVCLFFLRAINAHKKGCFFFLFFLYEKDCFLLWMFCSNMIYTAGWTWAFTAFCVELHSCYASVSWACQDPCCCSIWPMWKAWVRTHTLFKDHVFLSELHSPSYGRSLLCNKSEIHWMWIIWTVAVLAYCYHLNVSCVSPVSYTHLTLPTRRTV